MGIKLQRMNHESITRCHDVMQPNTKSTAEHATYTHHVIANLKMIKPINIYSKDKVVNLQQRRYRIYALGGWGAKVNDFRIIFINTSTNETFESTKAFWPLQTHSYNRRAKRILIVDILQEGIYKVIFQSPESIELKWSNLFLINRIHSKIPNNEIDVLITTKLGVNPIID